MMSIVLFDIELQLVKGYEILRVLHQQVLLKCLIQECNLNARRIRETMHSRDAVHNIKFFSQHAIIRENSITSRSIKEAVRIIDSRTVEESHEKEN